mgnify:CR=1 FL=1
MKNRKRILRTKSWENAEEPDDMDGYDYEDPEDEV